MSLLFYTVANGKYKSFIPIYIYFALEKNPDSHVEIGISDVSKYKINNKEIIEILREKFGHRFTLSDVDLDTFSARAARFTTEPVRASDFKYVYIGDIDVLILESKILDQHLNNMKRNDAPFSNIIRPGESTQGEYYRLSGLHFAPTSLQYPLPTDSEFENIDSANIRGADEHILYRLMNKKGKMISTDMNFRPVHGIHVRVGAHPFSTPGWTGVQNDAYQESFIKIMSQKSFGKMHDELDIFGKNMLNITENICRGRFKKHKKEANMYINDNYVNYWKVKKKLARTPLGVVYRYLIKS